MEYKHIIFSIDQGVGKIVLNRPDVLNSFNTGMGAEVQDALDQCAANNLVRAVLLTGEGRGFCAGQDLEEAMSPDTKIENVVRGTYNPIVNKIRGIEKPVICAVNGVAAGAGANLAFCCDLTVAGRNAKFIQSFIKIGLIPDSGGTYILPRLVGMQRAAAMTMLGDKMTAEEAKELGLIYQVVDDEALMDTATALAARLAQMPTVGLGLIKRGLNHGLTCDLPTQLDFEADIQAAAANSDDYKEGVSAFLEKRAPVYTGQ
ncbi:MAG: 2-(1,2-epoxy-1,2-dihydrophenyl)acetyl-CoA isomerase [Flavobacteriales bacterium]|nr:2-(1,2-epoxy-1,2-dihydrophenyl)acetyl-CoA isomerase [Flavobacteriales bacterium]